MKNSKLYQVFAFMLVLLFIAVQVQAAAVVTMEKMGRTDNSERYRIGTIAFDSSYPTGGESITAADLNLASIRNFTVEDNSGYLFEYDKTNSLMKAYYPSGSPAVSNAAELTHTHAAVNGYQGPLAGITKPALTLTHTADTGTTQAALPVYAVESYGVGSQNVLTLQSTTNGNADILAAFEETTGVLAPGTPRYVVTDNNSPAGVQVYVNTTGDILEFVSPTATDGYIIAHIEAVADTAPGYSLRVKVNHSASAATGSALYFDDNGAADVQLFFTDPGAAGGVIPAADIDIVGPMYWDADDAIAVSAAGSSHTHTATATAESADEVGNTDSLAALTAVRFYAVGY